MRCWIFHKWTKWTAANIKGTDHKHNTTFRVGVQWRECQRCGYRQQKRVMNHE